MDHMSGVQYFIQCSKTYCIQIYGPHVWCPLNLVYGLLVFCDNAVKLCVWITCVL